jgi:hypothetical protein
LTSLNVQRNVDVPFSAGQASDTGLARMMFMADSYGLAAGYELVCLIG